MRARAQNYQFLVGATQSQGLQKQMQHNNVYHKLEPNSYYNFSTILISPDSDLTWLTAIRPDNSIMALCKWLIIVYSPPGPSDKGIRLPRKRRRRDRQLREKIGNLFCVHHGPPPLRLISVCYNALENFLRASR